MEYIDYSLDILDVYNYDAITLIIQPMDVPLTDTKDLECYQNFPKHNKIGSDINKTIELSLHLTHLSRKQTTVMRDYLVYSDEHSEHIVKEVCCVKEY